MSMSKSSVPEAAERLGVSPARIRQRINEGSLVAEKIGGRWLLDLEASSPQRPHLGRPVSPPAVWWSLAAAEVAVSLATKPGAADHSLLYRMKRAELLLADLAGASVPKAPSDGASVDTAPQGKHLDFMASVFVAEAEKLSRSSRDRAIHRFAAAVEYEDHNALLVWLSNRGARMMYVAAGSDLPALRADNRLLLSGLSHPDSNLEAPRIAEAYVNRADADAVVTDFWLEKPGVDERPNVILHVVPVRPPAMSTLLLAADLAEHSGPREVQRAHELVSLAMNRLIATQGDAQGPLEGPLP